MKLGVCYYPEHWPEERWAIDARLMRGAGLSIVRIGEFAWAQMEPSEGHFDWGWLDRAIEALAAEGLQIVLGTPTPTPPAWLVRTYPDVLPVDNQGRVRRFGSRRHVCANSLSYRRHTERIVTALAQRYGSHPALIGWQIDNEFGCHNTARCYCDRCVIAFREWLRNRYGSLDTLNEAWGAAFWSQLYSAWDQIEPPILAVTEQNASQMLDYYRFSSDSWVAYERLQADLLRQRSPGKPISHNFMGSFPDLDYHALAQPLDFVTWDSYPAGFAEQAAQQLYHPDDPRPVLAYDAGDPYVTGFCHAITRGTKSAPFWVMEQQCGNVNWSQYNTGVRPGTVRLWTWHALASDAEAVVFFRWRACRFAQEQMHSGLLHHDASPAVGYRDVQAMAADRESMAAFGAEPHVAEVALLSDYSDLWALDLQPHRKDFSYQRHQFRFYRALHRWGIPVDIVSPRADLSRYKLVISPTSFLANEEVASALRAYVLGGGTLLLGVRSGFKTPSNLVNHQPLPGLLRELVGVTVTDWHALPPGVAYYVAYGEETVPAGFWAEALEPESGTEALATYIAGPFAGAAAMSCRQHGAGSALYLGWYPTPQQVEAIVADLADRAGVDRLDELLPEGVIRARRGRSTMLLNFTEQVQHVDVSGQNLVVPSRDVVILA